MADIVLQKNVAALVKGVQSVPPQASAAQTIDGSAIDRVAHSLASSCVLHTETGADTGTPTTISVQSKVQDSADNSTWTDYKPDGSNVAQDAAITAVNTASDYAVDLTAARRYVRVVTVVGFTGGTSPTIGVAAGLVLAGENTLAAV